MSTQTQTTPEPQRLKSEFQGLDPAGHDLLFTEARSIRDFSPEPVSDGLLEQIWELARWAPTSTNSQPLRITHVRTAEGKARLIPLLDEKNQEKTRRAPVTTILATDLRFHERLPEVFPIHLGLRESFENGPSWYREKSANFNATLQAGYFVLAARSVGLSVGPMGGFDVEAVTREFFPDGDRHALLLVNLGYPGDTVIPPRLPRLAPDEVVRWE
ncbi:malonic semialdehyde reductase [Paenarthrobacter sp. YAF11_1]|uniref:malonic semialdehyde reductase n=1 Tax=Paenarthrobacter sp. YAF11_1 TaxID=3233074 RepID=UPI003F973D31